MKMRFLVAVVMLMLVAALAYGSAKSEEATGAAVEGPQYGGTLTLLSNASGAEPTNPDVMAGQWSSCQWLTPIQERPVIGDFEKYGPRGSGVFDFLVNSGQPEKYLKGNYLESWEVSPEKVIMRVRPGIMWHGNRPNVMKARELVAEDVAADMKYFLGSPPGKTIRPSIKDVYATDKYTVVLEFTAFDILWIYSLGYEDRGLIAPPETITAGADRWENQVGTGPFMLKEYRVGSHMAYERNPNWWKKTTIDGVEYELPFVDEMVIPIIPDASTQIAALRTGKIDIAQNVTPVNFSTLEKTAPDLKFIKRPPSGGSGVLLDCRRPPFDNRDVRRAMFIGTDLKEFHKLIGAGELPLHWYPQFMGDPEVYTPLDKLPKETRILYDYNPKLAMKMLADAGYPNGFKIKYYTTTEEMPMDRAALLKDQWAKIGVEVEIVAEETVVHNKHKYDRDYVDSTLSGGLISGTPMAHLMHGQSGAYFNFSVWSDPRFDEMADKAKVEINVDKRNAILKESAVLYLNEASAIPTTPGVDGHFWWPWLKNYYGEWNVGDTDIYSILAFAYIDQDLKKSMGY
jgi:peptide/nickel transport system substrate-binding protein